MIKKTRLNHEKLGLDIWIFVHGSIGSLRQWAARNMKLKRKDMAGCAFIHKRPGQLSLHFVKGDHVTLVHECLHTTENAWAAVRRRKRMSGVNEEEFRAYLCGGLYDLAILREKARGENLPAAKAEQVLGYVAEGLKKTHRRRGTK